jgi:polysaccharide biosynthesis/export protein
MRSRLDPRLVSLLAFGLLASLLSAPPLQAQSVSADYMVGPRDVLAVTVINEPTLSGKFTVVADGTVTYPLLGTIKVGGLSLRGVERELTAKLADGFLEKPVVIVALDQVGSQQVLVIGEVKQAGLYPLTGRTTVLEALLRAGATTQFAGTEALIVRGAVPQDKSSAGPAGTAGTASTSSDGSGGGSGGVGGMSAAAAAMAANAPGSRVERINLDALQRGDLTQNLLLNAGDMVFVPRVEASAPVYVTGHVKAPGAYQVAIGTTVLQALAQAGGATDRGSTGRLTVVRKVNGKPVEMKAHLHDTVQAGDTIIVGRRLF